MEGTSSNVKDPSPGGTTGFPLTTEFLEMAFKRGVKTFTSKVGTNPGDNYMSLIHAVCVTFKQDPEEKHYMLKCYPTHPARIQFLDKVNMFEKELMMYHDILQELQQFGAENNISLSLAPYHGGNVNGSNATINFKDGPFSKENFILMTDIRKEGFKMVNRIVGLDKTHTILVLNELAKLHALSWAYKQKHILAYISSKYAILSDQTYNQPDMKDEFKPLMTNIAKLTMKVVEEMYGKEHEATKNLKKLYAADIMSLVMKQSVEIPGIDEDLQESYLRIKPKEDTNYVKDPWLVLCHGDCWVNNMLFKYNDDQQPGRPTDLTMVDFQFSREACLTTDLTHVLFTSVRAPLRFAHETEFLQSYFDAFTGYCNLLQVNTVPGFTFENLQRRYRRSKIYGLSLSTIVLSFTLKPPQESVDMDQAEQGENIVDILSSVTDGADENIVFKDEITASVLSLYEEGVL